MKTLTSKKVRSNRPPQKPLAATSSLTPSSLIAEAPESASPVIGSRVGSMHTSWQTSAIKFAVRSLISLCRMVGKPPFGHDRACSTEKLVPQAHVVGVCKGCQPYLRAMLYVQVIRVCVRIVDYSRVASCEREAGVRPSNAVLVDSTSCLSG